MMKKITYLIMIVLAIGMNGYSQDLMLGFEAGESGGVNGGPFGGMPAPTVLAGTGSNTSQVLEIVGNTTGEPWQGINLNLTNNVDLTSTQTMTIDVKSATPITFLVKVNGGVSGAPEAAAEVTHNGDDTWQTLSFTFNTALDNQAPMANGVYSTFVIHAYWEQGETSFFPGGNPIDRPARTFYVDNISGPATVNTCANGEQDGDETGVDCGGSCPNACPEAPTTAPMAPPSRSAANVISVYGEAYGAALGLNNVPWDAPTDFTEVMIDGNNVLKIDFGVFMGSSLGSVADASGMTHFHMDFWVANPWEAGQVFNPKLSNHAQGSGETNAIEATVALPGDGTQNQTWVSYDVEIATLIDTDPGDDNAPFERANITEFLITVGGNINEAYIDNVYFHNNVVLSNDEFVKDTFRAYPNPTQDIWTVKGQNAQIETIRVYDVLGKQVLALTPNSSEAIISSSGLKSGIYFAQIETLTGIDNIRLIKQ